MLPPLEAVVPPLFRSARIVLATGACLYLIIAISDLLYCWIKTRQRSWAPCVPGKSLLRGRLGRGQKDYNYDSEFATAYQKYSRAGKAFSTTDIPGTDYFIVVPPRHCDEWAGAARDHLSWGGLMGEEYYLNDLGLDLTWNVRTLTVQACNRSEFLERIERFIMDELDTSIAQTLGSTKEWQTQGLLEMTFLLSRHVAVLVVLGPHFSKETGISELLTAFNMELADRMGSHQHYPMLWKPIVRRFSKKTRRVKATMEAMRNILKPEILRRSGQRQRHRSPDTSYLDTMIELVKKKHATGSCPEDAVTSRLDMMADHVVFLLFEVIGAITPVTATLLLQLAMTPEYAVPLRNELTAALEQTGEGRLFRAFKHTPKLQSFTKETMRMHTPIKLVGGGYVQKPLHLPSLNRTLTPGTKIVLPGRWTHLDQDNYRDPMVFDGYRLCEGPDGKCDVRGITTPSAKWLLFGIGTSACPARLLGIRMCQALFAKILLGHDLAADLEDCEPLFLHSEANMFVNPRAKVRVRPLDRDGCE